MNDISTMLPPLGKSGGAGEQLRAGTDGARTKTDRSAAASCVLFLRLFCPYRNFWKRRRCWRIFRRAICLCLHFFTMRCRRAF